MTRVRVIVEGQTEEAFVKETLAPALFQYDVYVAPTLIGRPGHQGGRVTFDRICRDLILSLKQDAECYCTTLVDYYGLGNGFVDVSRELSAASKAAALETSIFEAVDAATPGLRADQRCFPYIQLFEFEALLFSDVERLTQAVYAPAARLPLEAIRGQFTTPEDINNSKETAPSKRLKRHVSSYNKVLHGSLAASHIGINAIVQQCPRFSEWFNHLTALALR